MIDTNKLKLKHHLRIHTLVAGYPTLEDVLFEIVSFCEDRPELEAFSPKLVRQAFSFKPEPGQVEDLLAALAETGYLSQQAEGKYAVVSHPWTVEK